MAYQENLEANVLALNSCNIHSNRWDMDTWQTDCLPSFVYMKINLYGIWLLFEAKEDMTSPRAERDLLMFWASLRRSPWTSVFASLSLPAKSTSQSLLLVHSPFITFFAFTVMQIILQGNENTFFRGIYDVIAYTRGGKMDRVGSTFFSLSFFWIF